MKNEQNTRRMPLAAWIGFGLAAVLLVFNGYTAAKYYETREVEKRPVYAAQEFYFESDLLSETGSKYTLQSGVDTISFTLRNYADELRSSDCEISYEVTLSSSSEKKQGTIPAGKNEVPLEFTNLEAGTYTVTAKATAPYTAELKANFVVQADERVGISVRDSKGSADVLVTLKTVDFEGPVTLNWPDGLLPDNTDPLLSSATGDSTVIDLEASSSYTFRFLKKTPDSDTVCSYDTFEDLGSGITTYSMS